MFITCTWQSSNSRADSRHMINGEIWLRLAADAASSLRCKYLGCSMDINFLEHALQYCVVCWRAGSHLRWRREAPAHLLLVEKAPARNKATTTCSPTCNYTCDYN